MAKKKIEQTIAGISEELAPIRQAAKKEATEKRLEETGYSVVGRRCQLCNLDADSCPRVNPDAPKCRQ